MEYTIFMQCLQALCYLQNAFTYFILWKYCIASPFDSYLCLDIACHHVHDYIEISSIYTTYLCLHYNILMFSLHHHQLASCNQVGISLLKLSNCIFTSIFHCSICVSSLLDGFCLNLKTVISKIHFKYIYIS